MSLHQLAQHMAEHGRNGDKMLVHMTPREVAGLQSLAMAHGGSLTINPHTGLPEANFLEKLAPALIGGAITYFSGGTIDPATAAMMVGGAETVRTGNLQQGLMAGLGAYGGASIGGSISTLSASQLAAQAAEDEAVKAAAERQALEQLGLEVAPEFGKNAAYDAAVAQSYKEAMEKSVAEASFLDRLGATKDYIMESDSPLKTLMNTGLPKAALMAGAPLLVDALGRVVQPTTGTSEIGRRYADVQQNVNPMTGTTTGYIRPFKYDPGGQRYTAQAPVKTYDWGTRSFDAGGIVDDADTTDTTQQTPQSMGMINPLGNLRDDDLQTSYDKAEKRGDIAGMRKYKKELELRNRLKNFRAYDEGGETKAEPPKTTEATKLTPTEEFYKNMAVSGSLTPDLVGLYFDEKSGKGIGVELDPYKGMPGRFKYFDKYGNGLNSSGFYAETLYKEADRLGIDLSGISALEKQLDATNVLFRPGELFPDSGSDHGIDFKAIERGELGSAYDWTKDPLVHLKGESGLRTLAENMAIANKLGIKPITSSLEPAQQAGLMSGGQKTPYYAYYDNNLINYYRDRAAAEAAQAAAGGAGYIFDLPDRPTMGYQGVGRGNNNQWQDIPGYTMVNPTRAPEIQQIAKMQQGLSEADRAAWHALQGRTEFIDGKYVTPEQAKEIQEGKIPPPEPVRPAVYTPQTYTSQQAYDYLSGQKPAQQQSPQNQQFLADNPMAAGYTSGQAYDYLLPFQPIQPMQNKAMGGIVALAQGGQYHLGDYSDGGRLLRGPGDGVSDDIPATIGDKQPARLADGEFVVPARIVSELGNGSTEAGARKLYAMMDRVQKARGKTTGKSRVAKDTNADKYLPA